MTDEDAEKWARARELAAEDEALREQHAEHKRANQLDARFRDAGPSAVLRMFESGTNENGQPLTQFEFEALCERWCAVFGELPPTGEPPAAVVREPLPPDDAMLRMRDVVRIVGLSKSTIKRWVGDPENDFPKPVQLSPRRIGWRADQVKAWRKRIESGGSGHRH